MKEDLLNELDKYFNLPSDLSEIEYLEMTIGDNVEEIFLWYYKRQLTELGWYKYEREESNQTKPSGAILYVLENKVKGWIEAISKAEYYILYSDRVTVHYRDFLGDLDMKEVDYKPLVDAIKDCINFYPLSKTSVKTGDYNAIIQEVSNSLLSVFSGYSIGKYNKAQSKVNKLFVKSLYPYFRYLKEKEEVMPIEEQKTNSSLYLNIMTKLGLPINYENQIKNAFSNKKDPPPSKIDIQNRQAI